MRLSLWAAALFAAIGLFVLAGCGDSPPAVDSSNTEATVSGLVTIDGVPATEGEVVFDPSNIKRPGAVPRKASIGKDGRYTVKTLLGENTIKLSGNVAHKSQILQRAQKALNVQAGDNPFDMTFDSK